MKIDYKLEVRRIIPDARIFVKNDITHLNIKLSYFGVYANSYGYIGKSLCYPVNIDVDINESELWKRAYYHLYYSSLRFYLCQNIKFIWYNICKNLNFASWHRE